jgi:hypothetical protein
MSQVEVVVDIPATVAVFAAMGTSLTASWFAWRFSQTVGGEMGAAFKWVMLGVVIFALTRVDDVLKVSGTFAKMGIDYKRVMWTPHSVIVFLSWTLITWGFYKMYKAFAV